MKQFKLFIVLFVLVTFAVAANAATYGYVVVRGKNAEQIEREISTFERLVKTWKNGEVLYTHTVKSGFAFMFKKVVSTVFFSGDQKSISALLTSGPYEGDYVRDVVVRFTFSSLKSEDNYEGEIVTTFTRKYTNVKKAIEEIKGKDCASMWKSFEDSRARDYKKHLAKGRLISPTASVVFYSVQPIEENRMFGLTFEEMKITNRSDKY